MDVFKGAVLALSLMVLGGCRLNVSVEGEGVVTSDNGKIECPNDCKAKLKRGKDMTLTAEATDGSYFASWQGCDEESGNTCVVVGRNKNRRVTAVFSEDKSLQDSGLSQDLKDCATDNGYALTDTLSKVLKLECDGLEAGSDAFSVDGVAELANMTTLVITDAQAGIASFDDLADLIKIETLKLNNVGLDDVSALQDLEGTNLITIDLRENPNIDCLSVADLKAELPGVSIPSVCDDLR